MTRLIGKIHGTGNKHFNKRRREKRERDRSRGMRKGSEKMEPRDADCLFEKSVRWLEEAAGSGISLR